VSSDEPLSRKASLHEGTPSAQNMPVYASRIKASHVGKRARRLSGA
jgi:hypothetical protein